MTFNTPPPAASMPEVTQIPQSSGDAFRNVLMGAITGAFIGSFALPALVSFFSGGFLPVAEILLAEGAVGAIAGAAAGALYKLAASALQIIKM